jgi:hypothetical protein
MNFEPTGRTGWNAIWPATIRTSNRKPPISLGFAATSRHADIPVPVYPCIYILMAGDALSIAEQRGLLSGGRTLVVRGRMPSLLVERAKNKSGIQSDSKLIEAALANIVAADDYAG